MKCQSVSVNPLPGRFGAPQGIPQKPDNAPSAMPQPRFGRSSDTATLVIAGGFLGVMLGGGYLLNKRLKNQSERLLTQFKEISPEALGEKRLLLMNILDGKNPYALNWAIKTLVRLPLPEGDKVSKLLPLLRHQNMGVRNLAQSAVQFMVLDNRVNPKVRNLLKELVLEIPVVRHIDSKGHIAYSERSELYEPLERKLLLAASQSSPVSGGEPLPVVEKPVPLPHIEAATVMVNPTLLYRPNVYVLGGAQA